MCHPVKISLKSLYLPIFCFGICFRLILCNDKPPLLALHRDFVPSIKSCPFQPSALQKNLRRGFFIFSTPIINCQSAFFHPSSLPVTSPHTISNTFPLSILTAIRLFCSSVFKSVIPSSSLSFSKSKSLSLKQFKSILLFLPFMFYSL